MPCAVSDTAIWDADLPIVSDTSAAPVLHYSGRRTQFWPPSRKSAPQLVVGWAALAYVLWIFIREKRNKAVEKVLFHNGVFLSVFPLVFGKV
eukprot:SAG31_NODE_5893_length_2270_cov_1.878858_4_plen_92_part_00